jgi:hypothetical protein
MKLFSIIFIALVAVASALPVSDNLELSDRLTDDSNDISDLQASVLDAQQASEHQASKAMASILLEASSERTSDVPSDGQGSPSAKQAEVVQSNGHGSPSSIPGEVPCCPHQ